MHCFYCVTVVGILAVVVAEGGGYVLLSATEVIPAVFVVTVDVGLVVATGPTTMVMVLASVVVAAATTVLAGTVVVHLGNRVVASAEAVVMSSTEADV